MVADSTREARTPPCDSCGATIDQGDAYCGECGAAQQVVQVVPQAAFCWQCGVASVAGATFCGSCGASLSTTAPAVPVSTTVATASPTPTAHTGAVAGGAAFALGQIDRSWSARVARGIRVAMAALRVIGKEPGLLMVPIVTALLGGLIFLGTGLLSIDVLLHDGIGPTVGVWFLACIAFTFVSTIGRAIIVYRVMAYFDGRSVGNVSSFAAVTKQIGPLAGWALLSTSVGALIRSMERRSGILGILAIMVMIVAQIAWSAITFFVIPVIVFEGLGPIPAIRRSAGIVRTCWGEGVVGVGVVSSILGLGVFVIGLMCVLLLASHMTILGIGLYAMAIVAGSWLAAVTYPTVMTILYRYATTGEIPAGFELEDILASFRPRRGIAARLGTA